MTDHYDQQIKVGAAALHKTSRKGVKLYDCHSGNTDYELASRVYGEYLNSYLPSQTNLRVEKGT
jgi:hypothetical protein